MQFICAGLKCYYPVSYAVLGVFGCTDKICYLFTKKVLLNALNPLFYVILLDIEQIDI